MGAVGATGLVVESTPQTISVVAAAIIALGFDPVAKIPMGLALRCWDVARAGLVSVTIGYLALILSVALIFLVLIWTGVVMMLSYRRYLIPGALVALMIIEAAVMVGMALAVAEPTLMYEGLERFGLDVLLIVVGGVLVVLLKQTIFHRRVPIV